MRIVEILVAVNAACGIAAFLLARGAIRRAKEKLGLDEKGEPHEHSRVPPRD